MRRILCLVICLAMLSGCGSLTGGEPSAEEKEPAAAQMVLEPELPLSAAPEGEAVRAMTEDEVAVAYQQAARVWSWFELSPLDHTADRKTVDGVSYWLVDPAEMENLGALEAQLSRSFTEELTEQLLSTGGDHPLYREIDRQLYVTSGGRKADPAKGRQQVEVLQESETCYFVNVTVDLLDMDRQTVIGLECWSFPYELVDGQWVFTSFRLVN